MGRQYVEPSSSVRVWTKNRRYDRPTVDLRHEEVIVETDRYRISGSLTLPREGYRSRLSDYVNQRDREFFSIQDATLIALDDPSHVQQVKFVMVARQHIRMVQPAGEQ